MKKNLLLLTALVSMFYYAGNAQAGFLLEPFAGMEFNSTGDAAGSDVDITGTSVGARVGFQNLGLMLGLDGRKISLNLETENGYDFDIAYTQLGLFVGYDFPMMLRIWGNYVFSLEGENEDSNTKYTDGSGLVLGLGYKVVPFVSLNFEMGNTKTTKVKSGSTEIDSDYKINSYLLSVSFPLTL
jgi:hypothetical protein